MNLTENIATSGFNAVLDSLLDYPVELMTEDQCSNHYEFWNNFINELRTAVASSPEAKKRSRDYYRRNKRRILAKKKRLRQNRAHKKKSEVMAKRGKTTSGKEKQLRRGSRGGHSNLKTEADAAFQAECFRKYSSRYKAAPIEPVRSHKSLSEYLTPEKDKLMNEVREIGKEWGRSPDHKISVTHYNRNSGNVETVDADLFMIRAIREINELIEIK